MIQILVNFQNSLDLSWISAIRPRTLPLAASSIIAGSALALGEHTFHNFNQSLKIAGFTLLTALLLQILSNLANDYGDFAKGTDNEDRIGPERAMQSGAISKKQMFRALLLVTALTLISGITLLYLSFGKDFTNPKTLVLFGLGLLSIGAAIKYTVGDNAYGYKAMGDIFVFVFFGLVGVLGSYFVITHQINWQIVLVGIAFGAFSTLVLNLNNMRDIDNDKSSGKITIPVKIGFERAKSYHATLNLIGWGALVVFLLVRDTKAIALMFLPGYIFYKNLKFVLANEDKAALNPELKKIALATFALAIMIAIAVYLEEIFGMR